MVYIVNRSKLYSRIFVYKIIQPLRSHKEGNHHLTFIYGLFAVVYNTRFKQLPFEV